MEMKKDLNLTRNGEDRFYDVVDNPLFHADPTKPAQLILEAIKEEMEVPYFADYLKRYIHKAQGLGENQEVLPLEYYVESVIASFKARETPASFKATTTTLRNAAKNWLTKQAVTRETVFLLGFGLNMAVEDVNTLLTKALYEQSINAKDPFEVICWYCYKNGLNYLAYESFWEEYCSLPAEASMGDFSLSATVAMRSTMNTIDSEKSLFSYLATLKATKNLSKVSRATKKQFDDLYDKVKAIVGQDKGGSADNVNPADVEEYIYSGVPKTASGNLVKEKLSQLKEFFVAERMGRKRIGELISGKVVVSRFDIITLSFVVHASRLNVLPQTLYSDFCKETNRILNECCMQELIVQNPYENFLMCCTLTAIPMETYWDVWDRSFD